MPKTFIKSKSQPNQPGPGFRTADHFKGSIFGPSNKKFNSQNMKFNPSQFRTQHKGG